MAPLHQLTAKTTKKKYPYHYLMLITFLKEVMKVTSEFKLRTFLRIISTLERQKIGLIFSRAGNRFAFVKRKKRVYMRESFVLSLQCHLTYLYVHFSMSSVRNRVKVSIANKVVLVSQFSHRKLFYLRSWFCKTFSKRKSLLNGSDRNLNFFFHRKPSKKLLIIMNHCYLMKLSRSALCWAVIMRLCFLLMIRGKVQSNCKSIQIKWRLAVVINLLQSL